MIVMSDQNDRAMMYELCNRARPFDILSSIAPHLDVPLFEIASRRFDIRVIVDLRRADLCQCVCPDRLVYRAVSEGIEEAMTLLVAKASAVHSAEIEGSVE